MYDRLLPQLWMIVPTEERKLIAKTFNIPRTGITEIRDSNVISDGYTYDDLAHVTIEKMAEYVGSTESFPRLWELTVSKARFELNPPIGIITSTTQNDETPKQDEGGTRKRVKK